MAQTIDSLEEITEIRYDIWKMEAERFSEDIKNKDYEQAYKRFQRNPTLTFALPILYVNEGYWGLAKTYGYEIAGEFLDSCERALNRGELKDSLRQLKLRRNDSWPSGVHDLE